MKAKELKVGDLITFDLPKEHARGVFSVLDKGGPFKVFEVRPESAVVTTNVGSFIVTDAGLLNWAVKVKENGESEKAKREGKKHEIPAFEDEEVCETPTPPEAGVEEKAADGEDESYFQAKADRGKPAARLIPLHALVPREDEQFRELGKYIYHEYYDDALVVLDDIISELYPGEDVTTFAQMALDYGLEKYGKEGGWAFVPDGQLRYRDAAARHFIAHVWRGKDVDEESGLNHLAHLAANLLFLNSEELE